MKHGAMTSGAAPVRSWRAFGRDVAIVLALDTLIAAFLVTFVPAGFWHVFTYSQSIGLTICAVSWLLKLVARDHRPGLALTLAAVPLGGGVGTWLGSRLTGSDLGSLLAEHPRVLLTTLGAALLFGTAISYYFFARSELAEREARLRQDRVERLTDEQRLAEASLKLLQAQIEPHFLFNTLSNLVGLIEADPPAARRMLENLVAYLRASLQRTRAGPTTLGEELTLVRAYLEIQGVRMGSRLRWAIEVPDELRALELPPLLLQPLVENAVRHGLEPRPGGGSVAVRATRAGRDLVLEVEDTGLGLTGDPAPGIGLTNVRARLAAIYPERSSLQVKPNGSEGLSVRITIPLPGTAP